MSPGERIIVPTGANGTRAIADGQSLRSFMPTVAKIKDAFPIPSTATLARAGHLLFPNTAIAVGSQP